jgi:hypothetical protein
MRFSKSSIAAMSLILTVLWSERGGAQPQNTKSSAKPPLAAAIRSDELRLQSEVVRSLEESRKSLEKLRVIYENDLRRRKERLEVLRGLFEKEIISRLELEQEERAAASVESQLKDLRRSILEEEVAFTEAVAREELLRQGPQAIGGYTESAALVRFNGAAKWSLANLQQIEAFFMAKFGRALPISALGQTTVHDRMKFDHRDAVDVPIHPDSGEGRALMAHLREAGIPFIAFRGKMPGAATGAHIHIGKPSPRNGLPE